MASGGNYAPGPFGSHTERGAGIAPQRTVLAVVHHHTAITRLPDVLAPLETDTRLQTVYTVPPSYFSRGVADRLRVSGAALISFDHATELRWDLAVATGDAALERINGPVLRVQHGVGPNKLRHRRAGSGPAASRSATGFRREAFVRDGRVIPARIALAHHDHRRRLLEICPEAEAAAIVTGDIALDRIMESLRLRESYRRALGVSGDRRLVFVSSTWGPRGLFGRHRELITRLAEELPPDRYAVVVSLHPGIWGWHGNRQIFAWFDAERRLGLGLLPPYEGWCAAMAAADLAVGDMGSVSNYCAASGIPTMLVPFSSEDVAPGGQADLLAQFSPRLDPERALLPQIEEFLEQQAGSEKIFAPVLRNRLTSEPGRALALLRREMYKLLRLPEPEGPPRVEPVPEPRLAAPTAP